MEARPLVSVITPSYNAEKFIGESIDSILSQSYENFELIVLDDASTDATWELLKEYVKKDPRIKVVRNERNLYIAGNRNKGISLARGKYIIWQDADDIALPGRIETLVDFMEQNPDVGICGSYIQSFMGKKLLDVRSYPTSDIELRKSIFKFSPVAQPAAIIRKKALDEVGPYDLETPPAEDLDMSFRIGTKYKFANIPEVLLKYREHKNSATHQKFKKQIRSTLMSRRKYSRGYRYTMNFSDKIAYILTWFVQWLPPRVSINAFKLLRRLVNG